MNEDEFREQLIKDLEAKELICINLHRCTFDIYVPTLKKFIELKKIVDLSRTPKTSGKSGIRFTRCETEALKKLYKFQLYDNLPLVVIMDEMSNSNNYFIIRSNDLKEDIEKRTRKTKKRIIISKHYFDTKPLNYEQMLNEIIKLKKD